MPTPSSKTLWRSLRIDRGPYRPEKEVRELLTALCRRHDLHARFLNTLCWMEHLGSAKILLSQRGTGLPEDVLRHLAEEARHAQFFRRAAERIAARELLCVDEDALAASAARAYMGRLDAGISRELGYDGGLCYRYVTLVVELRAEWLYRLYEEVLRAEASPLTLASVLSEEEAHLREVSDALRESDPEHAPRRRVFEALESSLFERWLRAMREAAFPSPRAQAQWSLL